MCMSRQLIFLRKSDCLGCAVLLCLVCLFDLACFFVPSFSSLIKTCTRNTNRVYAEGCYNAVHCLVQAPTVWPQISVFFACHLARENVMNERFATLVPMHQVLPEMPSLLGRHRLTLERRVLRFQNELVTHHGWSHSHEHGTCLFILVNE